MESKKLLTILVVVLVIGGGMIALLNTNSLKELPPNEDNWTSGQILSYVKYAHESDAQYLNLYIPYESELKNSDGDIPLIIMVHGGGFFANDASSKETAAMYAYFRDKGYACASVNYRLSDEAQFPAAVNDVVQAVDYLLENAESYGIDSKRAAIWGESAGAYLATMAALKTGKLSALISFYGPMEFWRMDSDYERLNLPVFVRKLVGNSSDGYTDTFDSPESRFVGKSIGSLSDEEKEALSPISLLNNNADALKDLKVYIRHGNYDITVPYLQSERIAAEYEKVGCTVDYELIKGYKHADRRFYSVTNLEKVQSFLSSVF